MLTTQLAVTPVDVYSLYPMVASKLNLWITGYLATNLVIKLRTVAGITRQRLNPITE